MRTILVTGSAGFIGFHLAKLLLSEGFTVVGFDGMVDYYDVRLKQRRHQALRQNPGFVGYEAMLEDMPALEKAFDHKPDMVVHLAAQAGVRYSIENPRAYIQANVVGGFNVTELAHAHKVEHLLMSSTSSVYGGNEDMPFQEVHKADLPLTVYAASKKANENIAHVYANLYKMPVTMFRFFTVYGPWGRPDMALFKFTKHILEGRPIDIYNHGEMYRDFTYITDLVRAIRLLMDVIPEEPTGADAIAPGDTLSPVAPFRVVNIGAGAPVRLLDFVDELETQLGVKAIRNYLPMQPGELTHTYANCDLLERLTGYKPETALPEGIREFVAWYRDYYQV